MVGRLKVAPAWALAGMLYEMENQGQDQDTMDPPIMMPVEKADGGVVTTEDALQIRNLIIKLAATALATPGIVHTPVACHTALVTPPLATQRAVSHLPVPAETEEEG